MFKLLGQFFKLIEPHVKNIQIINLQNKHVETIIYRLKTGHNNNYDRLKYALAQDLLDLVDLTDTHRSSSDFRFLLNPLLSALSFLPPCYGGLSWTKAWPCNYTELPDLLRLVLHTNLPAPYFYINIR